MVSNNTVMGVLTRITAYLYIFPSIFNGLQSQRAVFDKNKGTGHRRRHGPNACSARSHFIYETDTAVPIVDVEDHMLFLLPGGRLWQSTVSDLLRDNLFDEGKTHRRQRK